jgi:hypothetical protein
MVSWLMVSGPVARQDTMAEEHGKSTDIHFMAARKQRGGVWGRAREGKRERVNMPLLASLLLPLLFYLGPSL